MTSKAVVRRKPHWTLIIAYLQVHLNEWVSYVRLREIAEMDDVPRKVRDLKAQGWPIDRADAQCRLRPEEPEIIQLAEGVKGVLRVAILERDSGKCQLCGAAAGEIDMNGRTVHLEIDHIIPRSLGGKTEPDNLRTLCRQCNHDRQNRFLPTETTV